MKGEIQLSFAELPIQIQIIAHNSLLGWPNALVRRLSNSMAINIEHLDFSMRSSAERFSIHWSASHPANGLSSGTKRWCNKLRIKFMIGRRTHPSCCRIRYVSVAAIVADSVAPIAQYSMKKILLVARLSSSFYWFWEERKNIKCI